MINKIYLKKLFYFFLFNLNVKKKLIRFFLYLSLPLNLVKLSSSVEFKEISFNNYYSFYRLFLPINGKVSNNSYNYFYWLSTYLGFWVKNYTKFFISWQFLNLNLKKHNVNILTLWRNTYKRYILKNFFCSAWFYFFLLIQLYFFKNLEHFTIFFSKIIARHPLQGHKKLFLIMGRLFKIYLNLLYKKNKLKGYRLYFKGKLGRKGSVKKSVVYFQGGAISYTSKSLKFNYKYFLIPTETGVVGCYLAVFYIQMFTFIFLYLFLYCLTYIFIFLYLSTLYTFLNLEQMYLNYFLNILKKYFTNSVVIVLLFLLTGLPPVGFFFIKFNFLLSSYYNMPIIFQILIFFNILLTMFFYLQVFNSSNTSINLSSKSVNLLKKNTILKQNSEKFTNLLYTFYYKCFIFFFINFFFIFFFSDFFLIFFNIINMCQQKIKK